MHAEFFQQDHRGSRFISGRSISSAPVFSRNYYVTERRARGDKDAEETVASGGWKIEIKKARVCFCTCVPSQRRGCFRMQEIGRAPQSERNLQTQFPGQTDGQTNEPARANRGPFAVPTTSICCTRTGCGFNNASP